MSCAWVGVARATVPIFLFFWGVFERATKQKKKRTIFLSKLRAALFHGNNGTTETCRSVVVLVLLLLFLGKELRRYLVARKMGSASLLIISGTSLCRSCNVAFDGNDVCRVFAASIDFFIESSLWTDEFHGKPKRANQRRYGSE